MDLKSIVIVGAGQAGGWAAKTLRSQGYSGRIVLLGDEPHPPYERPPLSKAVLLGTAAPESTHLFSAESLAALRLDLRLETGATVINRQQHLVLTTTGERVHYDKLILCTGGRARALMVAGAGRSGLHTLRSMADAVALRKAMARSRSVCVVGGGWIGLEVASSARALGRRVSVVEVAPQLCVRTVPPDFAADLLNLHERHGVEIRLNSGVHKIAEHTAGLRVLLTDGLELQTDLVVAGIGLEPNDWLAREASLDCNGGILVDEQCRTSDPDILAAGDVAVSLNPWAGGRIRLESWQNAQNQGIAAAIAALGLDVCYRPLPWFWSDQHGRTIQMVGIPRSEHRTLVLGDPDGGAFARVYFEEQCPVAAIGVDATRALAQLRRLIEGTQRITDAQLVQRILPLIR